MKNPRLISQVVSTYTKNDAVSHHVSTLKSWLTDLGYESDIYAEYMDKCGTYPCREIDELWKQDQDGLLVIYHHSIGSSFVPLFIDFKAPIIVVYHNVTPAKYFSEKYLQEACMDGLRQLSLLENVSLLAWADSEYNKRELMGFGFKKVFVLPILREYEKLAQTEVDTQFLANFKENRTPIILFVGRIAPNKGIHDLVSIFYLYRKIVDSNVKLLLVGKIIPDYFTKLKKMMTSLDLGMSFYNEDMKSDSSPILFCPNIDNEKLAAAYKSSSLFMTMSDHEGFCVPLVEAMFFGLPIIAHSSSAIPETCQGKCHVIDKYEPEKVLQIMENLLNTDKYAAEAHKRSFEGAQRYGEVELKKSFNQVIKDSLQVLNA